MGKIADICRKYGVRELAVFGSALRDDFRIQSDVDFLVVFENDDAGPWAGKYMDMEEELTAIVGRHVDVVGRRAVEEDLNPVRRRRILGSARVLYAA